MELELINYLKKKNPELIRKLTIEQLYKLIDNLIRLLTNNGKDPMMLMYEKSYSPAPCHRVYEPYEHAEHCYKTGINSFTTDINLNWDYRNQGDYSYGVEDADIRYTHSTFPDGKELRFHKLTFKYKKMNNIDFSQWWNNDSCELKEKYNLIGFIQKLHNKYDFWITPKPTKIFQTVGNYNN